MDEVRLHPVCDLCEGGGVDASVRVVVGIASHPAGTERLDQPTLMVVDVCAEHASAVATTEVLAAHGRPLSRRRTAPRLTASGERVGRKPGPRGGQSYVATTCPVCDAALWGTRSIIRHVEVLHGWRKPKIGLRCPDCGFKGVNRMGILKHRNARHGFTMMTAMAEVNR